MEILIYCKQADRFRIRGAKLSETVISRKSDSAQQTAELKEILSVPLPKELYLKIEKRLAKTEFKSVGEYVTYVLEQVLLELETSDSARLQKEQIDNPFSKQDQESVEQKLRDLGYL